MGMPEEPYIQIVVETYIESGSGLHGDIHVRPIAGQQLFHRVCELVSESAP